MKFMMIVKATKDSESGAMPDEKILAAMAKYNEALTAVDRAIQEAPSLPDPPRHYDDTRVTPINLATYKCRLRFP